MWATVMSRTRPDVAIVDAGLKASSVDSGMPRVADFPQAEFLKASDEPVRRETVAWMSSGFRWRDRDPERQARIAAALGEAGKDPRLAGHVLSAARGLGGPGDPDGVVDQARQSLPAGEVPAAFGRLDAIAALAWGFQPAGRRGRVVEPVAGADAEIPVLLASLARRAPGLADAARVLAMECALSVRGVLAKPGAEELAWLQVSAEGKDPEAAAEASRLLCLLPADPGVKAWAAKRMASAPAAERLGLLGVLLKGDADAAAIDAVTAALGKAEAAERAALAIEALRRLSGKAPSAWFDALAAGLSEADLSQALDAIAILEPHATEPDAARLLWRLAKEGKESEIRRAALEALAADGAAAASGLDAAALQGMMAKDVPAGIRKAALITAAALGRETLDPILKAEILAGSRLPMEALDALAGRRREGGPPRTLAATRLVAALGESDSAWLRAAAADRIRGVYEGLPEKARSEFARASIRFLADADPGVRGKAAESFETIAGSFDPEEDPAPAAAFAEAVRAEAAKIPLDNTEVLNFFTSLRDPALMEMVAVKGLATTREEILEGALSALEDAMTDDETAFQPTEKTLEALAKLLQDPYAAEDVRRNAASILAKTRAPGASRIVEGFLARANPEEEAIRQEIRDAREEVADDETPEGGAMPGVRPIQAKPAGPATEADAKAEAGKVGRVLWVKKDPRANAFFASIEGKFVALYDAEKRELERFDLFIELAVGNEVTARDAAFDASAVWVGTDRGLFRYGRADRGWAAVPMEGPLQDAAVTRLALDPDGRTLRVTVRPPEGFEQAWRLRLADSAWERVP
ncbi:MAG: hypothetical protein AAB215_08960 [Planctomycetota bacterium]